jgi:hypothetical protein
MRLVYIEGYVYFHFPTVCASASFGKYIVGEERGRARERERERERVSAIGDEGEGEIASERALG